MTRKKVTLAYITNDAERKASFRKRKKGLIKKVSELSTLCGVDACAIIYSPYDAQPEVWPSQLGAQAVLARFRKLSEMEQSRKMVNQESFTRQRIKKAEEQFRRLWKENKRREMETFLFQCLAGITTLDDFNLRDSAEMGWVLNQTLRDIRSRMETLRAGTPRQEAAVVTAPPPEEVPEIPFPVEHEEALMMGDELDSFPWNLVESPACGGLDDGGLGWDDGLVLPYPFLFSDDDAIAPGNQPGTGGN